MSGKRACAEAQALLSLSLDEELSPLERRKLERHVGECPDCLRRSANVEAMTRMLRDLPPEAPSALALPRLTLRRRLARSSIPAAAAVIFASLGLVALQGSVDLGQGNVSPPVQVSSAGLQSPITHSSQPQPQPQYSIAAFVLIP